MAAFNGAHLYVVNDKDKFLMYFIPSKLFILLTPSLIHPILTLSFLSALNGLKALMNKWKLS